MDKNTRDLSLFLRRIALLEISSFELLSLPFAPDYYLHTESKPVRRLKADLSPFYATYALLLDHFYDTLSIVTPFTRHFCIIFVIDAPLHSSHLSLGLDL